MLGFGDGAMTLDAGEFRMGGRIKQLGPHPHPLLRLAPLARLELSLVAVHALAVRDDGGRLGTSHGRGFPGIDGYDQTQHPQQEQR